VKKYILILGILALLIGGVWIYSSQKSKNLVTDSSQEFTDKGFTIAQGGKAISGQYITDTDNLNLGLKVYSNASIISEKSAAETININGVKATAATYKTDDSREKVENFYKTQIGSEAIVVEAIDGTITYRVIKAKTNIGSIVNVWAEDAVTYFTIIKPLK